MRLNLFILSLLLSWDIAILLANERDQKRFDLNHLNRSEGLKIRGYVEGMYGHEINNTPVKRFNASPYYINEFDISYAFVDFTFKKDRFRSTIAVHHGSLVEELYVLENELWKQFREISGEYFFSEALGLEFGNLPSHFGYEGFIKKENWFATRAIMTDFAPDFDLGIRLNYRPTPDWLIRLQLANGWHTLRDTNEYKAYSTFIRYDDNALLVGWSTMYTTEPHRLSLWNPGPIASEFNPISPISDMVYQYQRYYSNFFMHYKAELFWIGFLFDLALNEYNQAYLGEKEKRSHALWGSTSLFLKYFFLEHWALGSRTEYFYDPHTVIVPQIVTFGKRGFEMLGETITLEYAPVKYFTLRLDLRYYRFTEMVYVTDQKAPLNDLLAGKEATKLDDLLLVGAVAYEFYNLFKF